MQKKLGKVPRIKKKGKTHFRRKGFVRRLLKCVMQTSPTNYRFFLSLFRSHHISRGMFVLDNIVLPMVGIDVLSQPAVLGDICGGKKYLLIKAICEWSSVGNGGWQNRRCQLCAKENDDDAYLLINIKGTVA